MDSFAVLDDAATAIAHGPPGEPAFEDHGYAGSVFDARDDVLVLLGHYDEATGAAIAKVGRVKDYRLTDLLPEL
jgi:hypothetical protein